ncbi:MAG: HAD-IC family P-type ATPase, partial [Desulfuromonadales bacterium]|nr:HAD-IC family P-type ATPase [Desulfuromonadales bacterium]NIR33800.1 HAD-IC family P-type ATPase [Desulfuromonadales bacterium]NIS42503.1 HAD-IC family P-type ATPase [Desulfuromonadales bacterium]
MRYSIVHELPGRLRLQLELPRRPAVERDDVEAHFHDLIGIGKISFSPRTRTLLLRYDGRPSTRQALLRRLDSAPQPRARRRPLTELEQKKRTVVRSGTLLLLRPVIPPPIRPLITIAGAMPIFRRGVQSLRQGDVNVDVLDASAIAAAMGTRDFFTASMISFLLKLGDYLEEWTRKRSRAMLTEMFHTDESEWVWVVKEGEERRIPLEELAVGDTVVARTGGLIPADGRVVEGEAMVNQSSMTGESLAVMKRPGGSVYAGTAVEEGQILVRAEHVGEATRAARVVKVIEEAESLKGETQSHGEQLADRVVPYSFMLSGLTYLLTGNLRRAAAVLLVDYSCAIKLSTPLAVISSLAKATRHRVLIKGGKAIENLSRADAFVLDKTGTLTEARPQVVEVTAFNGFEEDYILRQAACVEEHFPHPVAQAVVAHAAELGLSHAEEHAEV